MKPGRFYFLLLWITACPVIASKTPPCEVNMPVFSKAGNIYYTQAPSHTIQITHLRKDSAPYYHSIKNGLLLLESAIR